jgi:hypothetical protein
MEIWKIHILPFVGVGCYRYVAGINRQLQMLYTKLFPLETTTPVILTISQAALAFFQQGADNAVLCPMAARGESLEALQFLCVERNCPWDASTCAAGRIGMV